MKQPSKDKKIKVTSEDTDFLKNWYANRLGILGRNNEQIILPKTAFNFNPEFVEKDFEDPTVYGEFDPSTKQIGLSPSYSSFPGVVGHEVNHFIQDQFSIPDFIKYISDPIYNIQNEATDKYIQERGRYGEYLLDPSEVHSRLMQFRQENKFKPDEIIDKDRLKNTKNRELFKLDMFDDEQILDLLNKTVQLESNDDLQIAKYGGTIKSKKMKKKNNYPKYEFGTYVDNPATDLVQNQINIAKAKQKAGNNPWVQGLDIFGNLAMQVGSSLMSKGMANGEGADGKGVAGFLNTNNGTIQSLMGVMGSMGNTGFAYGGNVPGMPAEVEGQEVGETPDGNLMEFVGPSHEGGGIPLSLPEGTEIYSKRIKVDGVSMADRKKKREKKTMSLESLLEKNNTDALIKNSLTRTKQNNELEESNDNKIQQLVKTLMEGKDNKYAYGTPVGGGPLTEEELYAQRLAMIPSFLNNFGQKDNSFSTNIDGVPYTSTTQPTFNNKGVTGSTTPATSTEENGFNINDIFGGMTAGDAIGIFGNLYQAFAPAKNTLANRAGDTPNINAFKDYGKEGLDVLQRSKGYINQIRDEKLQDLELSRTSGIKRNRAGARGINTLRALDLATDAAVNETKENTYSQFAQEMLGILSQEAGMENQQDQVVMSGEQARDLADRQDRDNFFTQRGIDLAAIGEGVSRTGGNLNDIKQRKVIENLINQLSAYGITVDSSGNLSNKKK